jgi:hypothetical protein
MKLLVPEPQISADKQTLSFVIGRRGESVTCVMPRRCLEVFFWLPPDADDARLVSVSRNGFPGSKRSRDANCWRDQRARSANRG